MCRRYSAQPKNLMNRRWMDKPIKTQEGSTLRCPSCAQYVYIMLNHCIHSTTAIFPVWKEGVSKCIQ
jgi:hypothetical protein